MEQSVYRNKLEYFRHEIERLNKTPEEACKIFKEWNDFVEDEKIHDIAIAFAEENWELMEMIIMELP